MRKPEVKEITMPAEVREAIEQMEKEPQLYYGITYPYEYVLYPEKQGNFLTLYWFEVGKAKEEQDYEISYITYIDFANEDWSTYLCKEEKWSRAGFDNLYRSGWGSSPRKLLLLDSEYSIFQLESWQRGITLKKLKAGQEKKDEKIIRLMEQAKPLSNAFLEWHEKTVMKESRYLIYRRSGKKTFEAFCTHCGEHLEMPASECRSDKKSTCPSCGSRITMKSEGRTKYLKDTCWTEYVQAVREGLMIRFVKMTKDYTTYGCPERIVREPCRVIIERGKKAKWYEIREENTTFPSKSKYQPNKMEGCIHGENFPKRPYFEAVYQRGMKSELRKAFPYNMFRQWLERKGGKLKKYTVYDYFDVYSRYPLIESLEKTGKRKIVDEVIENKQSLRNFNPKAKTVSELLGITRQQYREMKDPTMQEVKICRLMRERGIELGVRELGVLSKYIDTYDIERGRIDWILEHTTFRRFMKYMETQDEYQFHHYYLDYLSMGKQLEYDFSNEFVLFPRDPRQAHDAARLVLDEEKARAELEKEAMFEKGIMKVERKIRKYFSFEDEEFLIRPAKTNKEIIREGQIQHMCVGYAGYNRKMMEEESYILFLRRKEEPQTPFYTVEITPDYRILQRHGKNNQEHEEVSDVDRFLKKFVEVMKNGKKHHAGKR